MRKLVVCFLLFGMLGLKAQTINNIAYQDGKVRFTLITDGAIRLEYNPRGNFIDYRSFVAINRQYPKVDYKLKNSKKYVYILTKSLSLKYLKGEGPLTAKNLVIKSARGLFPFKWMPGLKDSLNLKGTIQTLDNMDGQYYISKDRRIKKELDDGLISKSGWTVIDDSKNFLFDNTDFAWVKERTDTLSQDVYFLGYGHNYKKALRDFTVFAGKVPLPPRYAFGYWWSHWWDYSDKEIRDLREHFAQYNIPIDVIVLDMDWHYSDGKRGLWTGYNWNTHLLPSAQGFINYLHQSGIKTTMNLHPASGIYPYDPHFKDMLIKMNLPDTTSHVPYVGSDKNFMKSYYGVMLRQYEKMGVDFWWYDWQQNLFDTKLKNLNNIWWINYVGFEDMLRNSSTRPMIYHRWGGLGNHRYPIGFSGDSYITWASLDFQPYFNATASNVLYSYWGHDLGGFYQKDFNPELYARWLQFGVFSPIFKTHYTKNNQVYKEPWLFNYKYFTIIRNTILNRYKILPYLYTMARETYDKALPICRPMYYDYPDKNEAYEMKNEYMFGDNMLVSPITKPSVEEISDNKVWLPSGNDWYEMSTGTLLHGGETLTRKFKLDEFPLYVKAGSILPFYGKVKNAQSNKDSIIVTVFPGASRGEFTIYEDNGVNKNYDVEYATTKLSQERKDSTLIIKIGVRKGHYSEMPANRKYCIEVLVSGVPRSLTINGKPGKFKYDGENLSVFVSIPETSCAIEKTVILNYPSKVPVLADGLLGQMHHIQYLVDEEKVRKNGFIPTDSLADLESIGSALSYFPEQLNERVITFRKSLMLLEGILRENKIQEDNIKWIMHQMYLK